MENFLFWLLAVVLALAGYLAFLWWSPRRRSRFQVRLTALFLLFALVPTVPLIFLASTLATNTADLLLVPQVETTMLKATEALKAQCEDRGRMLARVLDRGHAPESLAQLGLDYYFIWQRAGEELRLMAAYSRDQAANELGMRFNKENLRAVWGQTGSELETAQPPAPAETPGHCRVWLPGAENEMVVLGFPLAPEVVAAKAQLVQTMRVYNALAVIKEKALQGQLVWGAATALILVLAALAVLLARGFSRRLSHPLEDLIGATRRVAAGDLEAEAQTRAPDEIGQLVFAFNQMIRDLRAQREKLAAAERLAAWREAARQVSHEIKNPLTPIQLALYRIREKLGGTVAALPAVQESLQSMEEELSSLRRLAEEFAAFARLPKADLRPDNLNEIVQLAARLYEAGAEDVRFVLELDPDLPARPLDREQIKRVLNNLIKNAQEAAQPHACTIKITTRAEGGRVLLLIADEGPGLSPEMQARLFEPNFTTKRGGSGLGLVMVKRMVEEHGGEISAASAPGKGTVFKIRF